MIKTPLSTVIGGAFWTPGATVIDGAKLSFEIVMKKLFANGEQGFWYDPNDMGTMFQDAAGTVPVTAVGQTVGLILDKGKQLLRRKYNYTRENVVFNSSGVNVTTVVKGNTVADDIYNIKAVDGSTSFTVRGIGSSVTILVEFEVLAIRAGDIYLSPHSGSALAITTVGKYTAMIYANNTSGGLSFVRRTLPTDIDLRINSIHVLEGNHAYQTTSASRPILQDAPRRIDFDTVDDKLITTLPAQLTGCTVIRSVPGVGVQLLAGQTIPATYEDNKDHCGLIVINRALTPSETSAIAAEFNKRAGV